MPKCYINSCIREMHSLDEELSYQWRNQNLSAIIIFMTVPSWLNAFQINIYQYLLKQKFHFLYLFNHAFFGFYMKLVSPL